MTSLTLVRRIKARPSIVFDALTTPEGIACWWGPDGGPVLVAETDPRDEETRRSHEQGWNGALNKLERHFLQANEAAGQT